MRLALFSAVPLLAGLLSASGQSVLNQLERFTVSGTDFVRLSDWARVCDFQISSAHHSPEIRLATKWSKLVFTVDSTKAEINGVSVFLSFPIAARYGTTCIALLDLKTAVYPVLFPPKNQGSVPILSVCLDPGHGGKDPGNEEGWRQEKEYTLLLAREVRGLLAETGLKVTLTRMGDSFVPLPERPEFAKRHDADLFVSLHLNATLSDKNRVKGVEVYCMTPAGVSSTNARGEGAENSASRGNRWDAKNMLLAYQIQKSLVKGFGAEDRGVRHARFAVLRNADMPAVLVEAGYMSHPQEAKRIFDPRQRHQLAEAIVDGILAYKRLVERSE